MRLRYRQPLKREIQLKYIFWDSSVLYQWFYNWGKRNVSY